MPMLPDVLPAPATALMGGPPGRYASPNGWWRRIALRLVALISVPMMLAVLQREHCIRFGWSGDDQFFRECFSDLPAQYSIGGLNTGFGGYLAGQAHLTEPVLSGSVMSLLGGLVPGGSALEQSRFYFFYWVALITLLLAATVWCVIQLAPDDLQAAAQTALSPVIVLAAVLSTDALAVALVAGALLAWRRDKLTLTGILLGLGALTRGYVLFVAIALYLAAWRSDDLARAYRALLAAATTMLVVCAAFAIVAPDALAASYLSWWSGGAGYGSPWLIPAIATYTLPAWGVTLLALAGWGIAGFVGWVFVRDAYRPPTWAQTALVVTAMGLMVGKAMPVQASLVLVVLAAVSGIRWRDSLIWAGAEALHFVAIWLYVGALTHADRALPGPWYAAFLLIRIAGITWLVTRVWDASHYPSRHHARDVPARSAETADAELVSP